MTRNGWIVLMLIAIAALWLAATWSSRDDRSQRSDDNAAAPAPAQEIDPQPQPQPTPAAPPEEPVAEPSDPAAPADPKPATPPADPNVAELPPPEKTAAADELKARFASEPRESSAGALEKQIEAAFKGNESAPGLLKSAVCRKTVCRVETRWSPARAIGFMAAFTRLLMIPPEDTQTPRLFDSNLGISPEGEPDATGTRAVDVYLARLPQ